MPQNWEPDDWAEGIASRVARGITRLRGKRSAQWLSDRTKQIGFNISRSVITDLENGRRRYVSVHEVVILAAALGVAPLELLYGNDNANVVDYLPGENMARLAAVQRFSGINDDILRKYEEKVSHLSEASESMRLAAQEVSELMSTMVAQHKAQLDGG